MKQETNLSTSTTAGGVRKRKRTTPIKVSTQQSKKHQPQPLISIATNDLTSTQVAPCASSTLTSTDEFPPDDPVADHDVVSRFTSSSAFMPPPPLPALPPSELVVVAPSSSLTAIDNFDYSFPTAQSLRAAAAANMKDAPADRASGFVNSFASPMPISSLVDLPSSHHHSCAICSSSIVMPDRDVEVDTDTFEEDALKESRRTYLHCAGCFDYLHKHCVQRAVPAGDDRHTRVQRSSDRTWLCDACK